MKNNRIEGIDYLRAIMSVFVVVWHMEGGGRSLIFSKDKYLEHVFTLSDFVNFHMLLLAVPTFIFVSNFLYAMKVANSTALRKRLKKIFILLTFWPTAFILFNNGYRGLLNLVPHSLISFVITVLRAGNTIYFFFVCLMLCLLITHFISKLQLRLQLLGFVLSTLLLTCMPELTRLSGFYPLGAYWNPLNFIHFPFAAVLVAQNIDLVRANKKIVLCVSIVLFALFSIFEWNYSVGGIFFPGQGYAIPAYTRTSLLFGVLVLSIIALDPMIKSNAISRYMAKYSLALYCLHPFFLGPVKKLVANISHNGMVLTYGSIICVIVFSYTIAMVLRIYLNEKVIL